MERIPRLLTYGILLCSFLGWGILSSVYAADPQLFPTVSIASTDVSCPGGSDATAEAFISGQTSGYTYTYLWSTGATSKQIFGLAAGVYSVTVTESPTGYQFFDLVIVDEPDLLVLDLDVTNVPCFNQSTGGIDLTVTGGTAPYSYAWTNTSGQNIASSQDLSNVPVGTYQVVVTDFRGCTSVRNAALSQPLSSVDQQVIVQDVNCFLGSDGTISVTAFGGTPPYSYSWNGGTFTTPNLSNLTSGTYDLVLTDANGCTSTSSTLVNQPNAIQANFATSEVSCFNGTDGSIDLTVTGGTMPYNYLWTNSLLTLGNTEDLTGIAADQYFVTISDANGCAETLNTTISEPTEVILQAIPVPVACAGQATGSIDLQASGGTLPYTYTWTNGSSVQIDTTEDVSNLLADTYLATVTDANGCVKTLSVEITEPASPIVLEAQTLDILCFGENTGSIDLIPTGGTPPYQYSWSNGLTTEDIDQLLVGSYSVQVTDANGCIETLSATLSQPASPLTVVGQASPTTCFGFTDGSVDLTVSGGTGPYTYQWANSQFDLSFLTEDLANLQAETYFVEVTDANGCRLLDTLVVDQPDELTSTVIQTDILCFGESTGALDITMEGGTKPYAFQWTSGSFTEDLANVPAGTYELQLTDGQGCAFSQSFILTQPEEPLSIQANVTDATCAGGRDGAIDYEANGGTSPYNYLWSNSSSEENQFDLTAGTYDVLLTDANGCTRVDTFVIGQPEFFDITANITPVNCAGESSGRIELDIKGGTAPFQFLWRNSEFVLFANTQDLIDFPTETYSVVVTDTFGCIGEASFVLQEPDSLAIAVEKKDVSCFGANDGEIALTVTGGVPPYEYLWGNGATSSNLSSLGPNIYEVLVTDENGCGDPMGIEIEEPDPLEAIAFVQPASCIDKPDGIIELFVTGGRRGYTFFSNDLAVENPIEELLGGIYQIRVEDQTGCTWDSTINVPFLDVPCLEIPNAFTPNGDSKNDTWRIKNLSIYPVPQIFIFNQWGMKIYESTSNTFEWDGTFNGEPLPSQTYYYVIRPRPDRAEISGAVTIIR
ncbi:MAG: T9SS type B sorting domain-containing protein [Bacteroidota bacterium]